MELLTAAEMRAADETAQAWGLPARLLMEQAGWHLARVAAGMLADGAGHPAGASHATGASHAAGAGTVVVMAGRGNNGGDGLVAARYLHEWGLPVRVVLVGGPLGMTPEATANGELLERLGTVCQTLGDASRGLKPPEEQALAVLLAGAGLVVDALLGTGVRGAPRGAVARVIELINAAGRPVLAADIPSGLDADLGQARGPCVVATATVTFCRPKLGLLMHPGAGLAGRLLVAPLPIPQAVVAGLGSRASLITRAGAAAALPARPAAGHKGTFGHLLVVAGAVGYAGAPALAALAGLRAGAGMVTLAVPEPLVAPLTSKLTEVMVRPLAADASGGLAASAWPALERLLASADAVLAGPGLGRGEGARELVARLLSAWTGPLALDADGLNLLHLPELAGRTLPAVITPHPGEMGRLLETDAGRVEADRPAAARRAAADGGCLAILKGARTLVAEPGGHLWVNPTGNQGMATAGSGDVLAGLVGGLLAQGAFPGTLPRDAALAAVYLHGLAGDLAAAAASPRALIAGDILASLGRAFATLEGRQDWPAAARN